MHSKAFRVVGVIVGVLAIAWASLVLVSHIAWNRSAMATLAEWYLVAGGNERIFAGSQETTAYLEQRAATEDGIYVLPSSVNFSVPVKKSEAFDMQVFRLNTTSNTGKAVFYLHGGAYVNEIGTSHWNFLDSIAKRSGAQIIVPLYKLAPKHTYDEVWPAVLNCYLAAVDEFGASNITLMGDSAGGGFAAALAEELAQLGKEQPAKLVLLSPWVDITCSNPEIAAYEELDPMLAAPGLAEMGKAWAGSAWDDDPTKMDYRLCPLYGDVSKLQNVHIYVGTHEILYPDIMAFAQKLKDAGVESELVVGEGLNHVWPAYPIPEADKAQSEIASLIAE